MNVLSDQDLHQRLAGSRWCSDGAAIAREYELTDFANAIEFVNRVAQLAEAVNHHPDIHLYGWNKVRLELFTHSQGGITQADLDLAAQIDGLDQHAG
jgi:4a-hydroxytetrahydrobiopterin dehydratase